MIERMLIEGFQAHNRLDVKFDPRITAIVGPTDSGKSSILRALRWITTNRPRGDGFQRVGCERMKVRIKVDGETVRRERGGSKNLYAVGDMTYKAFGTGVPPAIAELVNVTEENFQGQQDSPFWFSLSPSEVARRLNKIVDLELSDAVITRLSARTRALKAEDGVCRTRLAQGQEAARGLSWVVSADRDMEALEVLQYQRERVQKERALLLADFSLLAVEARRGRRARCILPVGKRAVQLGDQVIESRRYRDVLAALVESVVDANERAKRVVPSIDDLTRRCDRLPAKRLGVIRLRAALKEAIKAKGESVLRGEELRDSRGAYETEVGDSCPVCGGPLK